VIDAMQYDAEREAKGNNLERRLESVAASFAGLIGVIVFFGCWVYAIMTYGWFLGLALGWIPSIFIAGIAILLSPLIGVALIIGLIGLAFFFLGWIK